MDSGVSKELENDATEKPKCMDEELSESTNTLPVSEPHVDRLIEEKTSVSVDVLPTVVSAKSAPTTKMGEAGRRNLILYAVGIFVCYFYYGILQEKITKGKYGEGEKQEKFHFTLALVCVQCIINAIFAKFMKTSYQRERDTTPVKLYAMCSMTYLGAMLASNHALQHVAYPTQVLGKSIKPIPVMILGVLLARKSYPLLKYMCVLLIVIGVALFMYKDEKQVSASGHSGIGTGEILLLISLTLDGLTGASQDKMRSEYKTISHSMMLMINVWSILWLSVALVATGEVFEFTAFASRHPMVLFNMVMFSLASALGQTFIFLTVTVYGPLMCSIVTTTRKFFTILGSVIIFQNPMSSRQWMGTGFVFAGLALDSVYGKEKKNR